jgi:hypothetical protein
MPLDYYVVLLYVVGNAANNFFGSVAKCRAAGCVMVLSLKNLQVSPAVNYHLRLCLVTNF